MEQPKFTPMRESSIPIEFSKLVPVASGRAMMIPWSYLHFATHMIMVVDYGQ